MIFEWFQSICIMIVFIILLSSNILNTGVQNMQDNWALYRCNPILMPFAGFIAPDGTSTQDNFSYCIQNLIEKIYIFIWFDCAPTTKWPTFWPVSCNATLLLPFGWKVIEGNDFIMFVLELTSFSSPYVKLIEILISKTSIY